MGKTSTTTRIIAALIAATAAAPGAALASRSYYIDEVTDYPPIGTLGGANDLNTVTASLQSAMIADGFSGSRYTNTGAWPQDYWDWNRVAGGMDQPYGDSRTVSVFAGHGGPGTLHFAPHNGATAATTASHMRLGAGPGSSGAATALAVYLACQVLNVNLGGGETQLGNVRQQLGYLNNIAIGDDEPRDVYVKTRTQSNRDAWLWTMNNGSGWNPITGAGERRKPIVVTESIEGSVDACWYYHHRQAWARDVQDLMVGTASAVCWEWME